MLDKTREKKCRVGIVGAGLTGMALAQKLAADGHHVTVFEHNDTIGGLNTWHDFGDFEWDRFYHVILPSDKNTIGLIKTLGMGNDLQWNRTYTGFFVDSKLYSISSNLEFLKFPLLSLMSKVRLAWTMLYASRVNNWQRLETLTVEQWLTRVSGRNTYEKLWKPLLLAKLGHSHTRVSAVFIWSYIKRMFSARDKSASAEHLGHVKGGYKSIFLQLTRRIERSGGSVATSAQVSKIAADEQDRIQVTVNDEVQTFDKVICTSPVNVLQQLVDPSLLDVAVKDQGEIEYLGVVCVILVTSESLSPYYVINIADETIPFTGVIGASNVIDAKNTGGKHLTYLPRYMLSTDPEMQHSDEHYKTTFIAGLKKMFPGFDEASLIGIHVNRAFKVQPLQVLNYSQKVPQVQTRHPDLYALNTSQFINATLNNNEVIGSVNRFHEKFRHEFNAVKTQ